MTRKLPKLKQLVGKPVKTVDISTLAFLLQQSRNKFFRVIWESNQNKRLKKTGEGAKYKERQVTKLYILTARNDFNFETSVRNELKRRGELQAAKDWDGPQERTWGDHIPHTPFVVYQAEGEPTRLYGNFLPATKPLTSKHAYHTIPGETGYYVEGEKVDDAEMKALEYARKAPETATDEARQKVHPVNTRLDDVLWFKIGGQWYRMKPPTMKEVEKLAIATKEYAEKVAAAA